MVQAQQWLGRYYPKEERSKIIKLFYPTLGISRIQNQLVRNEQLSGDLDLSDFFNLAELDCSKNQLTSLIIKNCSQLRELRCGTNRLTCLVLTNLINLEELRCQGNQLTQLELTNLTNLKILWCDNNQLTKLNLTNLPKLKNLWCSSNSLTDLSWLHSLNPSELIDLRIDSNKFSPSDLTIFSRFINLEALSINNNPFFGSLQPLQNLTRLRSLNIVNTNITTTWEHLWKVPSVDYFLIYQDKDKYQELVTYKEKSVLRRYRQLYNLSLWRQNQSGYLWLTQTLAKINPNLDISEILDKFEFFNVKTGAFYGDLNNLLLFWEINQTEITLLKRTIQNLRNLIAQHQQKLAKKITNHINQYPAEEKLLISLVQSYQELKKAEKRKICDVEELDKLEEDCEIICTQLLSAKVKREVIREIKKNCEELVEWELELENKVDSQFLWEKEKQQGIHYHIGQIIAQSSQVIVGGVNISGTNNAMKMITQQEETSQAFIELPPKQ